MMERGPLTHQRSPWLRQSDVRVKTGTVGAMWTRNVSDGVLRAIVAEEPAGWHLSISFADHKGTPSRYPRWDEIAHARDGLLPDDVDFIMWLPKRGEYVNFHPTTFHLHEHPEREPP